MTSRTRKTFRPEFKREAVKLLDQGDKDAAQLARELGIRRNQLYKWKAEVDAHGEAALWIFTLILIIHQQDSRQEITWQAKAVIIHMQLLLIKEAQGFLDLEVRHL